MLIELNRDFDIVHLTTKEIQALVVAWQSSAIRLDTVPHQMERGSVLPPGRSAAEEMALLKASQAPTPPVNAAASGQSGGGE